MVVLMRSSIGARVVLGGMLTDLSAILASHVSWSNQREKLFPYLNINGVFFLFAGLCCICLVFVYFFCPETKGVMLEDIEELFHKKASAKSPAFVEVKSPVAMA